MLIRHFGGKEHWKRIEIKDDEVGCGRFYALLPEIKPYFNPSHTFDEVPIDITVHKAYYKHHRAITCAITKWCNKVYKDLDFYVMEGYKLQGHDFSVLFTDLLHDNEWKLCPKEGRWWLGLASLERDLAVKEVKYLQAGWHKLTPEFCEHGPGYSKEFEKSFDNIR